MLTNFALEQLGYQKYTSSDCIKARFYMFMVYQIKGISLKSEGTPFQIFRKDDDDLVFGIGNSINEMAIEFMGRTFADDEKEWCKENRVSAPFLVISIAHPHLIESKPEYWKVEDDSTKRTIATFRSFQEPKDFLKKKAAKIMPNLITSLAVNFSTFNEYQLTDPHYQSIQFDRLFRKVYGKTDQDILVIPFTEGMIANLMKLKGINNEELQSKTQKAIQLVNKLNQRVCRYYYRAQNEKDPLNKFIYYCSVLDNHLEITANIFRGKKIRKQIESNMDRLTELNAGVKIDSIIHAGSLKTRFILCYLLKWYELTLQDYNNFESIRIARNNVAHGGEIDEEDLPISLAEKLCIKLLSGYSSN